jgi:hypothetical protein
MKPTSLFLWFAIGFTLSLLLIAHHAYPHGGGLHAYGCLEETHMFLKIISDEVWDVETGLKSGIMIGNSGVGIGSVWVEPFVFRKPCTNDLIVSREKSFRHAHIHFTAYELTRRMAEAVSEGFRVASSVLDAFLKTREVKVLDPVEVLRKIVEERKLSQKLTMRLCPVIWWNQRKIGSE